MAKIIRVKPTLADALDVQSVWQAIPDFAMGDISLKQFVALELRRPREKKRTSSRHQ